MLKISICLATGCSEGDSERLRTQGKKPPRVTTGPLQGDMLQADWHPPVGEKPSAEAGSHSGLAALLLALSDAPKARDFRRCICFEPEISAAEARVIAHHADHVTLTNLQTLEVDVAHHLAGCSYLALPSLATLEPDAARELARVRETLRLAGLVTLAASSARHLATHRGHLNLSGITVLEPGVADALARHRGSLILDGLQRATPEELKCLASHVGPVYLSSLPADTPGLTEAFAEFRFPSNVIFSPESAPPPGR